MARGLRFEFEGGPAAVAPLREADAPVSSVMIWKALAAPVTMLATHAMFAGPEIMLNLPEEARTFSATDVPAENQQVIPSAGDVIWFYQAPNLMAGLNDEVWEIGLFYGNGGRIFGPLGWTPCNILASVTEGLDEFADACAAIRISGARRLTLSRTD
ncbi:MAG: hypothetical protein JWO62_44 [Acidimicrobiaceae bacterium]|jgi:hypothetical protein|nr:hypothetical protein [Acidimicrobiaceae bacterium]